MVVGDSVALTLGRGIERWGALHGIAVLNDGKLGCTLLDGARVRGYWGVESRPFDSCKIRDQWQRDMQTFRPDLVVVLFGAWDVYDASWDGGNTWYSPGDASWNAHYTALVADAMHRLRRERRPGVVARHTVLHGRAGPRRSERAVVRPAPGRRGQRRSTGAVARSQHQFTSSVVHENGCPVDLATRPDGVHFDDAGADTMTTHLAPVILHSAGGLTPGPVTA